jgi:hypothetical protein
MMTRDAEATARLGRVLAIFPRHRTAILQLSLSDPEFRSLGEDLCAAHDSLAHFLALSDPEERPEVAEYRALIVELEAEVRAYVAVRLR